MLDKKLTFKDAVKVRDSITKSQLEQISKLYSKWAKEIAKKANEYKRKDTSSAPLSEKQMKELEKMLKEASAKVSNEVYTGTKQAITNVSKAVVRSNSRWMQSLGFTKKSCDAAFSHVPDSIVKSIITGNLYEGGWNLSKSIWGDNEDTLQRLHEVIAGGMAQNKSAYEIVKDIESFVSPMARKPWNLKDKDGKYIYPKRVDYNAQRLARTLSQHAYQQTFVATTKDNPFIMKYRWRSTGHRVCDICKARDGRIYEKDKLPLDHPNGFCIMEPVVDPDMNKKLVDWVKGGSNPAIDKYVKRFGYEIDSTKQSPLQKVAENFINMLVDKEKDAIKQYTGYSYSGVNSYLRGDERFETEDIKEIIKNVDSAMKKAIMNEDVLVFRGDDMKGLQGLINVEGRRGSWYEKGKNLDSLLGETVVNKSYMSTSMNEVLPQYRQGVVYHINVPKGANAADISNLSKQESEREVLINRNQEFEITNIKYKVDEEGYVYGEVHVYLDLKVKKP